MEDPDALTLTTPRLSLRPLTAMDVDAIHAVWTSPGVRRFLFDDCVLPFSRTREMIERNVRLFEERRFGLWGGWAHQGARVPRSEGAEARCVTGHAPIAFGGFWYFREPPELELVYGVAEDEWGHGYATELARALVAHAFDSLRMSCIQASTDGSNRASVRVLEKLGFRFVRHAKMGTGETLFYERRA